MMFYCVVPYIKVLIDVESGGTIEEDVEANITKLIRAPTSIQTLFYAGKELSDCH